MLTADKDSMLDAGAEVIVVGAGPAGLTAALYLARYRRRCLVFHDSTSRALRIPRSHNTPGFPDGIPGEELIARLTSQARQAGVEIVNRRIQSARATEDGFVLEDAEGDEWSARALVFATGVEDVGPGLPREIEDRGLRSGVLRYCPICDGLEAEGRRIAVLGADDHGAAEALFVRRYSDTVTLLAHRSFEVGPGVRDQLQKAGIRIEPSPVQTIEPNETDIVIGLGDDRRLTFDVLYPALGSKPRSGLPLSLGVPDGYGGKVEPGAPLGGPRSGVFVAGDVVEGLDQISVAFGHGALAATRAHNYLRALDGESLSSAERPERPVDV